MARIKGSVSNDLVREVIGLLADPDLNGPALENAVRAICPDPMVARRLIDWIPEAVGLALLARMKGQGSLPTTFSAKDRRGRWETFSLADEPIYILARDMADAMVGPEDRETMLTIASRSAVVDAVNTTLEQAAELNAGTLSGPALIGIPAEIYRKSWVSRIWPLYRK